MGCLENRSAIDALMMYLTEAQTNVRHNNVYTHPAPKRSLMANDIDVSFNCVVHESLISILTHYRSHGGV